MRRGARGRHAEEAGRTARAERELLRPGGRAQSWSGLVARSGRRQETLSERYKGDVPRCDEDGGERKEATPLRLVVSCAALRSQGRGGARATTRELGAPHWQLAPRGARRSGSGVLLAPRPCHPPASCNQNASQVQGQAYCWFKQAVVQSAAQRTDSKNASRQLIVQMQHCEDSERDRQQWPGPTSRRSATSGRLA